VGPWARNARSQTSVRILSYHAIGQGTCNLCVTLRDFEAQIRWLHQKYQIVSLGEFLASQAHGSDWPADAVMLTFDDALECVYTCAFPILRASGVPFSVFVPTAHVGGVFPLFNDRLPVLSWPQVKHLSDSGLVDFGSHGVSHRPLPELGPDQVHEELEQSRLKIEAAVERPCRAFCYPQSRVDKLSQKIIASCGYECAFGAAGLTRAGTPMYRLRRFQVERDMSLETFSTRLAHLDGTWRAKVEDIIW
jgi:peptidoglycan/xylan/chitin deacetylase (PgdA/CDA1 family)